MSFAAEPTTWSMPDDEEGVDSEQGQEPNPNDPDDLVGELYQLGRQLKDSDKDWDLGDELIILSAQYDKALRLGNGFNYVNKTLSDIFSFHLPESEEEDEYDTSGKINHVVVAENLLNKVSKEIKRIAADKKINLKQRDSEDVINQLKGATEEKISGEEKKDDTGVSHFEQELGNTDNDVGDFKKVKENVPEGTNSGVGIKGTHVHVNWADNYNEEKARYIIKLKEAQASNDDGSKDDLIGRLSKLIQILGELATNWKAVRSLKNAISTYETPDPVEDATLATLQATHQMLLKNRNRLKVNIKGQNLKDRLEKAKIEYQSIKNPAERMKAEQDMGLLELAASTDNNKSPEREARKKLIKALSKLVPDSFTGKKTRVFNMPDADTIQKLLQEISVGQSLRQPVEIKRIEDAQYKKQHKKVFDYIDPRTGKEKKMVDWSLVQLKGYEMHLREAMPTERSELKKVVKKKMELLIKVDNQDKYNKIISSLVKYKSDPEKLRETVRLLRSALKEDMIRDTIFEDFATSVGANKRFKKYLTDIDHMQQYEFDLEPWLSDGKIEHLEKAIKNGYILYNFYSDYDAKRKSKSKGPSSKTFYNYEVRVLEQLLPYLESILKRHKKSDATNTEQKEEDNE